MAIAIQQNIIDGFNAFKKKILPARMVERGEVGNRNGKILADWVRNSGNNVAQMTPEEISDACFRAASDDSLLRQIAWEVEPAKLKKIAENEKARNTVSSRADQEAFVQRARKSEAKDEAGKVQEAAKKSIEEYIATVMFVDGLKGQIKHGKTESVKVACRAHLDKAVKGNRDLVQAGKEIRAYVAKEYEQAEKASERV